MNRKRPVYVTLATEYDVKRIYDVAQQMCYRVHYKSRSVCNLEDLMTSKSRYTVHF